MSPPNHQLPEMAQGSFAKRSKDMLYRARVNVMSWTRFGYRARVRDWRRVPGAIRLLRNPIVIGGCGRSGTTLLTGLLDGHRAIQAIPAETTGLSPGAYGDHPVYGGAPHMNTLYRHVVAMDLAPTTRRICEKTPKNVQFYGPIIRYFGRRVRIINLVRDGRDVVLSVHPSRPGPYVEPNRWISDVQAGLRFEGHPQVRTVKYEDLVTNTEATMRLICEFIGESWDPQILQYQNNKRLGKVETNALGATANRFRPDARSVGKWKTTGSEWVEALMGNPEARALLRHYDYLN